MLYMLTQNIIKHQKKLVHIKILLIELLDMDLKLMDMMLKLVLKLALNSNILLYKTMDGVVVITILLMQLNMVKHHVINKEDHGVITFT